MADEYTLYDVRVHVRLDWRVWVCATPKPGCISTCDLWTTENVLLTGEWKSDRTVRC